MADAEVESAAAPDAGGAPGGAAGALQALLPEEVRAMGAYLGVDLMAGEHFLLAVAREAVVSPVLAPWEELEDDKAGPDQGLTLAHFRAQLDDLRDTSPTSELNLSTCGTHPRVNLSHMGDNVSLGERKGAK